MSTPTASRSTRPGPPPTSRCAAPLLAQRAGVEPKARLHITKGIPVAARHGRRQRGRRGRAGRLRRAWRTGLGRAELLELAASSAATSPFALVGGTAIGAGRGEQLTPALARGQYHWVLALSRGRAVHPRGVRRVRPAHRGAGAGRAPGRRRVMQALRSGDCEALGEALRNDLQPAACSLRPDLCETLEVGA